MIIEGFSRPDLPPPSDAPGDFESRVRDRRSTCDAPSEDDKLKEACRNLEALLWQQVITSMRQAYEVEGGVLGGGTDSAIWQSQLDQTWASSMAGRPQGLSSTLYRQLQRRLSAAQQDS